MGQKKTCCRRLEKLAPSDVATLGLRYRSRQRDIIRALLVIVGLISMFGCGKYSAPLAPEDLSPRPVDALAIAPSVEGVTFTWLSPDKDQRGKELRTMDGYRVYRKKVTQSSDLLDADVEYDLIGTLADTHIAELARLKEEARAAGKPTRSVRVPASSRQFSFTDTTVSSGERYAYQVIPYNQGSEEGDPGKLVLVHFKGESSEISVIPMNQATEDVF